MEFGFVPLQPPGLSLPSPSCSYGASISLSLHFPPLSAMLWGSWGERKERRGLPSSVPLWNCHLIGAPGPFVPSWFLCFYPLSRSSSFPLPADMADLLSHAPCRQLARWAGASGAVNRAALLCGFVRVPYFCVLIEVTHKRERLKKRTFPPPSSNPSHRFPGPRDILSYAPSVCPTCQPRSHQLGFHLVSPGGPRPPPPPTMAACLLLSDFWRAGVRMGMCLPTPVTWAPAGRLCCYILART